MKEMPHSFSLYTLIIYIACFNLSLSSPAKANEVYLSFNNDKDVTIDMVYAENRMIVPIWIEGAGEQYFILDTAASGGVISERLKVLLNISEDHVRIDTVKGAGGATTMEFVDLPLVRFGDKEFDELDAVVFKSDTFREYDGVMVNGILGVDILQHFNVDINIKKLEIKLSDKTDTVSFLESKTSGIPFESLAMPGFIQFKVDVNGVPVQAFLDSGGKRSILNWEAAQSMGIGKDHPGLKVRENGTRGIDGGQTQTSLYKFQKLQFDSSILTNNEVKIADLPVFKILGYNEGPVMLVGMDVLAHCSVSINYNTQVIKFCN